MSKSGFFNGIKKHLPHVKEETKRDVVDAAVFLGLGLPSLAMVVAGGTGTFIGGLVLLVPSPIQPLALPILATSLPTLGVGTVVAAATTAYEMDDTPYGAYDYD